MRFTRNVVAVLAVPFLLTSCDSDRLTQFGSFASAGTQYVQAFHKVVEEAGSAMIASDSATLLVARKQAGTGDPQAVIKDDQLLEEYLANLQKLDHHATLLGSYFEAITTLTNGKAADSTASAATGLLDSINSLNPSIEKLTFAGKSVKGYVNSGTNLVVAHFEVKALNEQLQKSVPVIDQALALQEAAVTALAEQLKASLNATLEVQESAMVINPYVSGPPSSWNADRESFLRARVTIDDVDHAKSAISQLRTSFKQLVENRSTSIDLTMVLNEINKMSGYASAIELSLEPKAQQ
jgi:hypothetical protein